MAFQAEAGASLCVQRVMLHMRRVGCAGEGTEDQSLWLSLAHSSHFLAGSIQKGFNQGVLDRSGSWHLDRGFRDDGSRLRLRAASRSNRARTYQLLVQSYPAPHARYSIVIKTGANLPGLKSCSSSYCVTLTQLLSLSVPQFPHQLNGDNNSTRLLGLL